MTTVLAPRATAATTLRVATVAPNDSPWGKVYSIWAHALEKKTNGAITVQMLWNGTAHSSSSMMSKLRSGQLEGASVSMTDLASIYPDVFALELPGAMRAWSELDPVRTALQPDVAIELSRAHLRFAWWEDLGLVHLFTRGYSARRPVDLAHQVLASSGMSTQDPVVRELASTLGVVAPDTSAVPSRPTSSPPSVYLGTASTRVVTQFDHVDDRVSWCGIAGALVFTEQALAALPPALVPIFDQISDRVSQSLPTRVRQNDFLAFAQLAQNASVVRHTPAENAEWDRLYARVTQRLANGKLSKATVNRVLAMRTLPLVP